MNSGGFVTVFGQMYSWHVVLSNRSTENITKLWNCVMMEKFGFNEIILKAPVTTAISCYQSYFRLPSYSYHAILPQEPSYSSKSHNLILLAWPHKNLELAFPLFAFISGWFICENNSCKAKLGREAYPLPWLSIKIISRQGRRAGAWIQSTDKDWLSELTTCYWGHLCVEKNPCRL